MSKLKKEETIEKTLQSFADLLLEQMQETRTYILKSIKNLEEATSHFQEQHELFQFYKSMDEKLSSNNKGDSNE